MSSSSSESDENLIQESLETFRKGLKSSLPLRHFSDYQDDTSVRVAAQKEFDMVLMHFVQEKACRIDMSRRGDVIQKLCSELNKMTEELVAKNQDSKTKSEAFLQKRVKVCHEDLQSAMEAKLLINPDMDLKKVEEILDNGKLKVADCFEYLWKHGNVGGFEKYKEKLEQKLDELKTEMVKKQSHHLQSQKKSDEDANKSIVELKDTVLEMSRLELQVTKHILKEKVQGIRDYITVNGKIMKEKSEKLYMELLGLLENSVKFLDEAAEDMSMEAAVGWIEKLNVQIQLCFVHNEKHENSSEVQNTGNEVEMPSNVSESVFTDMHQGERLDVSLVVEAEETKLAIVSVTSMQQETNVNLKKENELNSDLANTVGVHGEIVEATKKRPQQADDVTYASALPPTPKRLKQSSPSPDICTFKETEGTVTVTDNTLNVPSKDGDFPLLRAIREGESVWCIEKILENGANVNIKGKYDREFNAAHEVIASLVNNKRQSVTDALAILTLLKAKGFNLINDGCRKGLTPILFAMKYRNLNEEILTWFSNNGADFNAVEGTLKNSVLLQAIWCRQGANIIRKIIDLGGNPKHVNKWNWNALHVSARFGHEAALEIFMDNLDLKAVTGDGFTPLHLLFKDAELDYEPCLEMLLKKGADFGAKSKKGYVPLAMWMLGKRNPFPVLMKMKDTLPITEDIASATLTTIVKEIEQKKKCMPSSSAIPQNEFVQFISFLIQEKNAKLKWGLESQFTWTRCEWDKLDKGHFARNFFRELKTVGSVNCKGELVRITSKHLGELELHTQFSSDSVAVETILGCMLACKNYQGVTEVCRFVKRFCAKPIVSKE